jgi:hypothetical protein
LEGAGASSHGSDDHLELYLSTTLCRGAFPCGHSNTHQDTQAVRVSDVHRNTHGGDATFTNRGISSDRNACSGGNIHTVVDSLTADADETSSHGHAD